MGLLYLFPTNINETDFIIRSDASQPPTVTIKSYGLAWIFWVYAAAALLVLCFLGFSIYNPVLKLFSMATVLDKFLIGAVLATFVLVFLSIFIFLYWQIHIVISPENLCVEYRPFGIKFFSKNIPKDSAFNLSISHFMDSPNVARLDKNDQFNAFQNKGYFELIVKNNEKTVLLDRSSRKNDLEDLKNIIDSIRF